MYPPSGTGWLVTRVVLGGVLSCSKQELCIVTYPPTLLHSVINRLVSGRSRMHKRGTATGGIGQQLNTATCKDWNVRSGQVTRNISVNIYLPCHRWVMDSLLTRSSLKSFVLYDYTTVILLYSQQIMLFFGNAALPTTSWSFQPHCKDK